MKIYATMPWKMFRLHWIFNCGYRWIRVLGITCDFEIFRNSSKKVKLYANLNLEAFYSPIEDTVSFSTSVMDKRKYARKVNIGEDCWLAISEDEIIMEIQICNLSKYVGEDGKI